jgi:hypothetical protein
MLVSRKTLDIVEIGAFPALAFRADIGPIHHRKALIFSFAISSLRLVAMLTAG